MTGVQTCALPISIGKVEIERLRETKFDGTRQGHNFTVDRQIEPLVMASEISGLDDRHAYLKLGNNVARFAFDYLEMPVHTKDFIPRRDIVSAALGPAPTPVPPLPEDGERPPARSSERNRPEHPQASTTQQTTLALVSAQKEEPRTEVRAGESGNRKKEW